MEKKMGTTKMGYLAFRGQGLGFGFGVRGVGFRVKGLGFRV